MTVYDNRPEPVSADQGKSMPSSRLEIVQITDPQRAGLW
jgi:hypothetical protein